MKFKYEYCVNKGKNDYDCHGHPILTWLRGMIDIRLSDLLIKGNKKYINIPQIFYSIILHKKLYFQVLPGHQL